MNILYVSTIRKLLIASTVMMLSILAIQTLTMQRASAYDSSRLIDNNLFLDADSMSINQIQAFLEAKGSGLATKSFKFDCDAEGIGTTAKNAYLAAGAPCGQTVLASKVIYYPAQIYGISPKVLLATLQKEQSLITNPNPGSWEYNQAMGYGCPTSGSCSDESGFFWQMDNGTWALRYHYERANGNNTWWNNGGWVCGTAKTNYYSPNLYPYQNVKFYDPYSTEHYATLNIKNAATSALYCYTPHVFNNHANSPHPNEQNGSDRCWTWLPSAGTKGRCYTGSYNFVTSYEAWFGTTQGSPLFKVSGGSTYFLEWGNYYYAISSTDILYAYGLASYAPRTLSELPSDKTRGPNLERYAKFGSDNPEDPDFTAAIFVIDGGKKHGVPNSRMMTMHGITGYAKFDPNLAYMLRSGEPVRPVIRHPKGAIYVMDNDKKRGFPDWETYGNLSGPNYQGTNQVYSQQSFTNMTSRYIDAKSNGAPMLLNGKFFKQSGTAAIYLFDNNNRYLMDVASYAAWGGKTDYSFSGTLVGQIPSGGKTPVLVKSSGDAKYLVDTGKKKAFDTTVLAAWGFEDSQFTTVSDRALARLGNGNMKRLVTDHRPGIYYIEDGKRHGIPSLNDFSRLGFSWNNIDTINISSLTLLPRGADLYAPGALVRTPNGAVFMMDDGYIARGITSGSMFVRYGLNWHNVKNVTAKGIDGYTLETLKTILQDKATNKYYIVENGVYHYISDTAMGAAQYNLIGQTHNDIDGRVLSTLKKGKDLTRFVRASGPTVYYIENGERRAITTEAKFYELGGTWAKVIDISDDFMGEIPRGANL